MCLDNYDDSLLEILIYLIDSIDEKRSMINSCLKVKAEMILIVLFA